LDTTTETDKQGLWKIRPGVLADKAFVLSTWLRGLRYGNDWFEAIDADPYFRIYQTVIESILSRPGTKVDVACLKDDEDVILGYSVYQPSYLHWIFVKKAWRGIKIGKALMPNDIVSVTHLTAIGRKLLLKSPTKITFNPFL